VPQLWWEDWAELQIALSIIPASQTGLWQEPWKTSLIGVPWKEDRQNRNVPVTIDSGLSHGSKLKVKFGFLA